MNDRKYYHAALEYALLDGSALEERIHERIAALPRRRETRVRMPKRLIIALVAAAILLFSSVAVAATVLRNKAFKEQTNAILDETIHTVTQPLDIERHEGWQPNHLILFDNVMQTKEDVVCEVPDGEMQLAEFGYIGSEGITAEFFYLTKRDTPCTITELIVSIDGGPAKNAYQVNSFIYADDHYCGEAYFAQDDNPIWPGTTFVFAGKVNGVPFTLTYTFTEKTYQTLQQGIVDALNEHKDIVEQIPDQGTPIGYQVKNDILTEIAVKDNCLYFTIAHSPEPQIYPRGLAYDRYDRGLWPVIDGHTGQFWYLGNIDAENPDGAVYCTYLPYVEDSLPQESLISVFGIVFRYEWRTGKATVPQSDIEYEAWRRESMELSACYNDADWIWQFDEKLGDVRVTDLVFQTHSLWSEIGILFESEKGFPDKVEPPKVYINGTELKHVGEIDPLTSTDSYLRSDGKKLAYCMVGYSPAELGDTFTLTVEWSGSKTEITLKTSDAIRERANGIEEYKAVFYY